MAPDVGVLVAFAFGAGMVAFFSPCCVAMLPAYVSFALGRAEVSGSAAGAGGAEVSRRRRELGAIAVWGGLVVAALGLGRLAVEAIATFGGAAVPSSPEDRNLSVAMAAAGIVLALLGFALTADRKRLRAGLAFGGLATVGFLVVFVGIGLPIAYLASGLPSGLGYLAVGVGIALVGLGIYTLTGRRLPIRIPAFDPAGRGRFGFLLFGIAYGLASLSCTFPIFLSVVALAALSGGAAGVAALAAYALGKGSIMILVTVLSTASPAAVEGRLRKLLPRFDQLMAAVTILSGAFIAYYFGFLYAPR